MAFLDRSTNMANENLGVSGAYFRSILSLGQYRHSIGDIVSDPSGVLFYPIFDSFIKEERRVVAVISISTLWKLYFTDILPSTVKGLVCVISNSFGQTFSYRIDGAQATYLGEGDHHDKSFNHMRKLGLVSEYNTETRLAQSLSFTAVSMIDQSDYRIAVYPSKDTEERFLTDVPWIAAVVVAMIFMFAGAVFVAYSFFVDRRQAILMKRAITSGAIVSSLFPSQVRDKMYKERESQLVFDAAKTGQCDNDAPIADKFEHTSIIFADISGFTHWSSERSPEDVFLLLETLYGAFGALVMPREHHFLTLWIHAIPDKLAFRRSVFKVETIGGEFRFWYNGGLPVSQLHHRLLRGCDRNSKPARQPRCHSLPFRRGVHV